MEYKIILDLNIYPKDVIVSLAYVFTDKAYVSFDFVDDYKIEVSIEGKNGEISNLDKEFKNELINQMEYKNNFEKNKEIRQLILQRALMVVGNQNVTESDDDEFELDSDLEELFNSDNLDSAIDDVDDIMIPWEDADNRK